MRDYKTLFFLGIIFLFVPFLGIPEIFRDWVVAIAAIVLIGYAIYTRQIVKKEEGQEKEIFVESKGDVSQEEIKPEVLEEAEEIEEKLMREDNE